MTISEMGMPQNLILFSNKTHIWGMLAKVAECQIAMAYVDIDGNGRKSCSSTFWISLYSMRSCFTSPVGGGGGGGNPQKVYKKKNKLNF
jgi:hypothetical protein